MHPLVGRLRRVVRHEHPWGNDWRFSVPAYTMSTTFGLSIGLALGCLYTGIPYWPGPLGVATAAFLARALVQVQFHVERSRTPSAPGPTDAPA